MTTTEMSNSFSVLYNNITSNQAPGLNEYEKSLFLTQAQESIVMSLYNGTASRSFEETEEFTTYLSPLVRQVTLSVPEEDALHIVDETVVYKLPADLMFRTYESCMLSDPDNKFGCDAFLVQKRAIVVPVTQDEFWKTMSNPFKGPTAHKVLRLAYDKASEFNVDSLIDNTSKVDKYSELLSRYTIDSYTVRYIKRPSPIILTDLSTISSSLSINGETEEMACELNPQIHDRIVLEAVNLAKSVWRQ